DLGASSGADDIPPVSDLPGPIETRRLHFRANPGLITTHGAHAGRGYLDTLRSLSIGPAGPRRPRVRLLVRQAPEGPSHRASPGGHPEPGPEPGDRAGHRLGAGQRLRAPGRLRPGAGGADDAGRVLGAPRPRAVAPAHPPGRHLPRRRPGDPRA